VPLRRSVPLRRGAPLKRGMAPRRLVPVRRKRLDPRRGPDRSPDYLAWIRTLRCVVCGRPPGSVLIEAAHTNALGPRGLGQKASDFSAIPLCSGHHRELPASYHVLGETAFSLIHRLELSELVVAFRNRFCQQDVTPKPAD
jgi:hypothetical protein